MRKHTGMNTCQRLAERLHQFGLTTRESADRAIDCAADWPELPPKRLAQGLISVTILCEAVVQAHSEDVDFAEYGYRAIFREAQRLSGGAVTVTEVDLVGEPEEGRDLHFKVNGVAKCWDIQQESDDYLDLGAIETGIQDLAPGGDDPRVFHRLVSPQRYDDDHYLLATTEQAAALRSEFGLRIEVCGPDGLLLSGSRIED
ncbi:hypothetical protein [Kitasatospora cineracea]|uniref:Uncharacterized protein n=1 Tax=Kitasatospora cineracea TaxID=88074 RepID=A0A3N4RI25_9ACTN|nr:hypothetical protein [Kitasatospora cineracea]ROR42485.1 hypothetical protein EDD39_0605 [Kitasatospora cineracea]RPE32993.1 hypothetical protein EDD38_1267 [Kitasatospora cineracea]